MGTLEVEGLLGQRFLDITRGTPAKSELTAGGELTFRPQPDFGDVISSSSSVLTTVNHMITSLTKVSDQVEKGQGSFGKLVFDDALYKQAGKAINDLQSMVTYANSGQGSLGKLVYTDDLYNKVDGFVGKADGMLDDIKTQKGSLGKLMYDTSFHDDVKKFVDNANSACYRREGRQGIARQAAYRRRVLHQGHRNDGPHRHHRGPHRTR